MSCKHKTEVYSRIVGYYRPVQQWNNGKKAEYMNRKTYKVNFNAFEKEGAPDSVVEVEFRKPA